MNNTRYVVNLHILEQCNYKCKYCFAHYESNKILSLDQWKLIVDNVSESISVKRFNIAGGEPLLYPKLNELISYINSKGIPVSIITNGVLLSESFIEINSNAIDTIGISIDSFSEKTLNNLGCKTARGEILTKERLQFLSSKIKEANIKLKINTVVNRENYNELISNDLIHMNLDRWKVLKMKHFKNDSFDNSQLSITDNEFKHFLKRNNNLKNTVIEESMSNSYIIIDAQGYLLDHSGENYVRISDAKEKSFKEGFSKFKLNTELYNSRYNK